MGIEMEDLPDQMSLVALEERCQREIHNYHRGQPYNERYCLEIFYRAISQKDDAAWSLLVRSFGYMVARWLRNDASRDSALRYENEQYYIDRTFTRVWQATRSQDIVFPSLGAALNYLKITLTRVILDTLREHKRVMVSLPEPGSDYFFEEPSSEDEPDEGQRLWEAIENLVPAPREKRLAYLMIHCGLKPREVVYYCSKEFSDIREVYRLHRNILERLMRHADQIRWRLGDGEK